VLNQDIIRDIERKKEETARQLPELAMQAATYHVSTNVLHLATLYHNLKLKSNLWKLFLFGDEIFGNSDIQKPQQAYAPIPVKIEGGGGNEVHSALKNRTPSLSSKEEYCCQ
jgi:hypothetical protein